MAAKRELLLVVVVVLSCFLSAYSKEFDYFWHVRQWPPSICKLGSDSTECSSSLNYFTIKGLWPEYSGGQYPIDCNGPPYDEHVLMSKVPELVKYWPNLIGYDEFSWQQAWVRHGVCSSSKLNQVEYFTTALAIAQKYDLVAILAEAGIKPGQTSITKVTAEQVITSRVGAAPGLRCKKHENSYILDQVRLCFEKDGETPMACPSSASTGCPHAFAWPAPFVLDSMSDQ